MKMNEMAFWEKPREKLLKYGADTLTTAEVLAILLRTGTRDKSALELASELLHRKVEAICLPGHISIAVPVRWTCSQFS